jgi:protein TonB
VDESPVPVRTVAPKYPDKLYSERVSGIVTIECVIDRTGIVVDPVVKKSTRPDFEQPAIDAIAKWKFKPGKKDGLAVKVRVVLSLKFNADN